MELGVEDAIGAAFGILQTDFDHLLKLLEDGGLESRDHAGAITFLHEVERFRNRLALVDHQLVRDAQRRDLAGELCHSSLPRALAATLRISLPEAARRVRAADALAERESMLGQPLEPVRTHLASAQRDGEVSPEQVDIVARALAQVDRPGFDPGMVAAGERLLTEHAALFGPQDLRRLAARVVDGIDPDGTLPDDKVQQDRRYLHLRPTKDGGYAGEFRLTGGCGAKLQAILGPLARPRINSFETADGRRVEEPDPRHHAQRMHDALEDVCDRLLRTDSSVPDAGGTPATVIITVDLEHLLDNTGYAVAADGTLIPTEKARQLANAADVYYAATAARGEVLHLGRTRRIATRSQTVALIARDGGCSFPGCDAAPEWCERHHVVGWAEGGATDLDNLTLLCRYHHHNFLAKGWQCTINADGLPEWRPPAWVDRGRTPLVNHRIRGNLVVARTRRRN